MKLWKSVDEFTKIRDWYYNKSDCQMIYFFFYTATIFKYALFFIFKAMIATNLLDGTYITLAAMKDFRNNFMRYNFSSMFITDEIIFV